MGYVCRPDPAPGAVAFLLLAVPAPRREPGPEGSSWMRLLEQFLSCQVHGGDHGLSRVLGSPSGEPGDHVQPSTGTGAPDPACADAVGC